MKIGRLLFGILALSLAAFASAGPSPDRVAAIWSYAQNRIDRQVDVWFDAGDFPATIQMLKVSSELNPHDYDIVTNLGWMQENVQQYDAAAATYEMYRKNNPQDADNSLPLAQYYFMKKKYDKVPALLEPSMKVKGHPHPNVFRILAISYERLGKLSDAQRVLKHYIAVAPTDGQAKLNLARVERKLSKGG